MADVLRIKRRSSGGAGAPAALANAELAYNEVDNTLYYGFGGTAGAAAQRIPIAGTGAFLPLSGGVLNVGSGTSLILQPNGAGYNGIVQAGDAAVIGINYGGVGTGALTLTGWNNTPLGIRIDNATKTITVSGSGLISNAPATLYYGLHFGSYAVSSPSDFSRQIDLWGGIFGFSVTNNRLNYVVPNGSAHYFVVNNTDMAWVDNGGLTANAVTGGYLRSNGATDLYGAVNIYNNLSVVGLLNATYAATFGFNNADYSAIYMNAKANTNRITYYQSAGVTRWLLGVDASTESGGDTGSNFFLAAYHDNGASASTPLTVERATGRMTFNGPMLANGGLSFGTQLASAPNDLSKHISLYDGWGGFSVTGGALNIVASGAVQLTASTGVDIWNLLTAHAGISAPGLPTSSAGLSPGTLWNNGGFVCVA